MSRSPLALLPLALLCGALTAGCTFGPGLAPASGERAGVGERGAEGEGSAEGEGARGDGEGSGAEGEGSGGEGEGGAGEGEGAGGEGEGEGGEGEGGAGEGEGEGACVPGVGTCPVVDDSPLSTRSVSDVCGQWRGFVGFSGTEWTPVGDGSDTCDVGTLAQGAQDAAVARVTLYRWLAGLPSVALEPSLVDQEQACADVENGLGALNHVPDPSAPCYTAAGAQGAGSSNLAEGTDTVTSVDLFVDDGQVPSMGHRRWVLNPSAAVTAFGHKGAFTCMYSFSEEAGNDPDFLTWPPAGPVPVDASAGRYWFGTSHHDVPATAVIEVSVDGAPFAAVPFDVLPFGYGTLSTNIAFDLPGLQPWDYAHDGRVVTVRISGLDGGGTTLTYSTRYTACP